MIYYPLEVYYRVKAPALSLQEFYEQHMKNMLSDTAYKNMLEELHDMHVYSFNGYNLNENYNEYKNRYINSVKPKYFLYEQNSKVVETVTVNSALELQQFLEHAAVSDLEVLMTDEVKGYALMNPAEENMKTIGSSNVEVQPVYSNDISHILNHIK